MNRDRSPQCDGASLTGDSTFFGPNPMIPIRIVATWVFAQFLAGALIAQIPDRPNIVHIFADDLGYGSLGFTGQLGRPNAIQTPNLDALAANGMVFHNAYASTVCAPSRANLMTGYHNGHALLDRNGSNIADGFRAADVTVGKVLQDSGYATSVFGKWGFGGSTGGEGQELYGNPNGDGARIDAESPRI